LVVELGVEKGERLPEPATRIYEGITLPYLGLPARAALVVPALLLFLRAVQEKRTLPTDWHPKQ
jgi:hypothetical protein